MKVEIPMTLPSLNEYIYACKVQRGRWNKGNEMKRTLQYKLTPYLKDLGTYDKPVKIEFTWIEPNKKRDLDNICWAKKFILDAMVNTEIIPNDNCNYVKDFMDHFGYDKENPRIIVEVKEYE